MVSLESWVHPGERVIAALSGGADSVCLLVLLQEAQKRVDFELSALHVNHGIRETADRDEAFCRQLCEERKIPLTVCRVDVPGTCKKTGEGLEEAARRLRYEALEAEADSVEAATAGNAAKTAAAVPTATAVIALAHHGKDQAETVLMNLIRGSGLLGLCGMQARNGRYMRPLLSVSPEEIRDYLTSRGLTWMEDETNQDTAYFRNSVRHELLPMLERYNPSIVRTLAETAERLQEDEAVLEYYTQQALSAGAAAPGQDAAAGPGILTDQGIRTEALKALSKGLALRVLKKVIGAEIGSKDLSMDQLREVYGVAMGQSGKRAVIKNGAVYVKDGEYLYLQKEAAPVPALTIDSFPFSGTSPDGQWRIHAQITKIAGKNQSFSEKIYTKSFDYDKIYSALSFRTRAPGDRLTIGKGHKKLKDYLIDEKIPLKERDRLPVLADGSEILWVVGHRMGDRAKVSEDTERILTITVEKK